MSEGPPNKGMKLTTPGPDGASQLLPVRQLSGGRSRMEEPADWPVKGLLVHVAGQGPNGFRVVDVWESEGAFQRFGEKLMQVMKAIGIEGEPEVYPSHTVVSA